jgi:hypothetical protein
MIRQSSLTVPGRSQLTPVWPGRQYSLARITDVVQQCIHTCHRSRRRGKVGGLHRDVWLEVIIEKLRVCFQKVRIARETFRV